MHAGINSTKLALIPKLTNRTSTAHFRPISYCKTLYKCITKILSNHIKTSWGSINDQCQAASIHGRRISDNIFIAEELLRNYHRPFDPPWCATNIDLKKALDCLLGFFGGCYG